MYIVKLVNLPVVLIKHLFLYFSGIGTFGLTTRWKKLNNLYLTFAIYFFFFLVFSFENLINDTKMKLLKDAFEDNGLIFDFTKQIILILALITPKTKVSVLHKYVSYGS